jgi:hypothetical protein
MTSITLIVLTLKGHKGIKTCIFDISICKYASNLEHHRETMHKHMLNPHNPGSRECLQLLLCGQLRSGTGDTPVGNRQEGAPDC